MYKIKDTKRKELKAVEILHQEEILERTKRKLDPVQAFEIIKNESNGFSTSNVKAQEADELLHLLLNRDAKSASGTSSKKKKTSKKELSATEIQIQARARARALELLELELELELNTKSA
ncbi:hypothetical protein [Aquimarina algicola]|uniref:Uncharacterized protein n=1 Tax=Aquimarina algicola TaxID=2589995 RepID=A0A504JEP5_9FLAO|nr:hypothetical protein [Aquimarina algicola]TPN87152.1 hypothetical protein FHK87_06060 [Aquimarina algicola]